MHKRSRLGIREAFAQYKGELPSSVYRQIIKFYYKKVIDAIIFDNLNYHINNIGDILIIKKKPKLNVKDGKLMHGLPVDWKATKSHGKVIYHTNNNRYGYIFRIKFKKLGFKNSSIYKFKPERWNFKRYLANILKNEDIKIDAPLM
jgi:hypothetical protein